MVYNRRFTMWSNYDGHFDVDERSPYSPARMQEGEQRRMAYAGRWNNKFEIAAQTLNEHDGNPFT